jgi:hypothetical protein
MLTMASKSNAEMFSPRRRMASFIEALGLDIL